MAVCFSAWKSHFIFEKTNQAIFAKATLIHLVSSLVTPYDPGSQNPGNPPHLLASSHPGFNMMWTDAVHGET